jgi:hypothetical protein
MVLVSLLGGLVASCSVVIDVDADCQDSACSPYVCDADAVACLSSCGSDIDCGTGYECAAGQCVAFSCAPVFSQVALALPQSIEELTAAFADRPAGELNQLLVIVSNRDGLGLRRYQDRGELVPDPPNNLPLVPIVSDNPSRRAFFPTARYFDSVSSDADGSSPRFQFGFVDVRQSSDVVARGQLVIEPAQAPVSVPLPIGAPVRGQFTNVRFDSIGDRTAVMFRDGAAGSSARMILTNFAGTGNANESQPLILSERGEAVGQVAVGAVGGRFLTLWAGTSESVVRIRASVVESDTPSVVPIILEGGINSVTSQVTRIEVAAVGDGAIAFWLVVSGGTPTLRAQVLTSADIDAISIGASPSTQPVTIDLPQGAPADFRILARGQEVGMASVLGSGSAQQLWLYRFSPTLQRVARPFRLAEGRLGGAPQFALTDNENGYGVVWRQDGGVDQSDIGWFQRFVCDGL